MKKGFLPALVCVLGSYAPASPALAEDVVTSLQAPVEDYAVARAGGCLVLKLKGQKGLTVYEVKSATLKTIELPTDDFVFGAGGDLAVVFLKQSNELQSWNLKTLSMVKAKEFADPINVVRVVMGHSRGDLALLRTSRGVETLSQAMNQILNVTTLSIVRLKTPPQLTTGHNGSFRDFVHLRSTGDMGRVTEWCTSHSPNGIGVYTVSPTGEMKIRYSHNSAGYLAVGDDGLIYTGSGDVFDPSGEPVGPFAEIPSVGKVEGMSLIPGQGGLFFLGLDGQGVLRVFQAGSPSPKPLGLLGKFPEWVAPRAGNNTRQQAQGNVKLPPDMADQFGQSLLTLDKRVLFEPAEGFVVFLPQSNDKLIRRPFDFKQFMNSTGKDYLLIKNQAPPRVKAGQTWTYAVDALANHEPVAFRLETAPEGMTISPRGVLTWKVPSGIEGKAKVAVAITDASAKVIHHKFEIAFD